MRNANLYGWIFSFNPYTQYWYAAKREDYFKLFSNQADKSILKSKEITTLEFLINKFDGNLSRINLFIKTQKNGKKDKAY